MKMLPILLILMIILSFMTGGYIYGYKIGYSTGWHDCERWEAYQEICPTLEGFDEHEKVMGR